MVRLIVRKDDNGHVECEIEVEFGLLCHVDEVTRRVSSLYMRWVWYTQLAKSLILQFHGDSAQVSNERHAEPLDESLCHNKERLAAAERFMVQLSGGSNNPMTVDRIEGEISKLTMAIGVAPVDEQGSDQHQYCLWWAGAAMRKAHSKTVLRDWFGGNNKSTVRLILAAETQPPTRRAPIDEESYKNMLAFYHKREHELKQLNEDNDDSYLESVWTDPRELKQALNGVSLGAIKFKPPIL